jgi:hypothetical protein
MRRVTEAIVGSPRTRSLGLLPLVALLVALAPSGAAADDQEVECTEIKMVFADESYERACYKETFMFSGMAGTGHRDILEATSLDGSHFLTAVNIVAQGQVILTRTPLHKQIEGMFHLDNISDWSDGKAVGSLVTSEFDADVKGIPSHCVGFQHFFGHETGGYRGLTVGFGCSRTDREMVYTALRELDIPSD